MDFPDKMTIERLRCEYTPGLRVELVFMDDPQAPPPGTIGEVTGVDDAGSVMVRWENGSHLSVIPGVDAVRIVSK